MYPLIKRFAPLSLLFVLVTCGFALYAPAARAATLTVTNTDDNGAGSLRQAISDAAPGDEIKFSVTGTIALTSGELAISKDLTINGPGARVLTVRRSSASGTPQFRVFHITSGTVAINGLRITGGDVAGGNGVSRWGGGVFNAGGTLTINRCTIGGATTSDGNNASFGGGIANLGTLTINNSTISGNNATGTGFSSGGGIYSSGALNLNNSTVTRNHVTYTGGGISFEGGGTAAINNSTIVENSRGYSYYGCSENSSTAVFVGYRAAMTARNSIIIGDNVCTSIATSNGGTFTDAGNNLTTGSPQLGALQNNGGATDTMLPQTGSPAIDAGNDNVLASPFNLSADQRGAFRKIGSHVDIGAVETGAAFFTVTKTDDTNDGACDADCSLREAVNAANSAATDDVVDFAPNVVGAIALSSTLPDLTSNIIIYGPGANLLSVERSAASGTPAFRILNVASGAIVTLSGLTIANGSSSSSGSGGINNGGLLTINASVISGNAGRYGGGVFNTGALTVNDSTFSGNTSNTQGGAVVNSANGAVTASLTINNCTFFGNSGPGGGGGVANLSSNFGRANLTVSNSTIAGNSAGTQTGGGIFSFRYDSTAAVTATIGGSLVALNRALVGPDVLGNFISNGYNLIGKTDRSSGFTSPTDLTGTTAAPLDPKLELDGNGMPFLKDNGGSTSTIALLCGSPAIDGGDPSSTLTTDQRGFSRPKDGNGDGTARIDIGAFELQAPLVCNQPPVANAGADQTVECTGSTTAVFLDGSASSDPDNDALSYEWKQGSNVVGTTATLNLQLAHGAYTFTLTVDDGHGASNSDSVQIVIQDTTPPQITLNGDNPLTILLGSAFNDPGATATDACDGNLTGSIVRTGNVNTNAVGTYTLTYAVSDRSGNSNSVQRTVYVTYGVKLLYDPAKPINSGSVLAVKVQLVDAGGVNKSSSSITLTALAPATAPPNANPGNRFIYYPTLGGKGGGYQFNLNTAGYPSGTNYLSFTVSGDRVTHRVPFTIR